MDKDNSFKEFMVEIQKSLDEWATPGSEKAIITFAVDNSSDDPQFVCGLAGDFNLASVAMGKAFVVNKGQSLSQQAILKTVLYNMLLLFVKCSSDIDMALVFDEKLCKKIKKRLESIEVNMKSKNGR